jgi:hypothetical protein
VTGAATELGHGVRIVFTTWRRHDPVGLIETHPAPDGDRHSAGVLFDLPGVAEAFPDRPLWTLEQLDPLTLSPSLQCKDCGHHGWIRAGRWEPC